MSSSPKFCPLKNWVRDCVRSGPWIAPAVLSFALIALVAVIFLRATTIVVAFIAAGAFICSFGLGYSIHLTRGWPRLQEFRRSQYSDVWDSLSLTADHAAAAAAGMVDETSLQSSGKRVAERIAAATSLKDSDDVLEIGCGVGRVGGGIARACRSWIGCDISKNMLSHAQRRLAELANVRFVHLEEAHLREIPDASVDVVYSTNMLAHLDPLDRWQYVLAAHRLLRSNGRLYLDTVALDSTDGWTMLSNNLAQRRNGIESPYAPTPSTPDELLAYCANAGFVQSRADRIDSLLIVTAIKPLHQDSQLVI